MGNQRSRERIGCQMTLRKWGNILGRRRRYSLLRSKLMLLKQYRLIYYNLFNLLVHALFL